MFQKEIILKYDLAAENLSYVIFCHFSSNMRESILAFSILEIMKSAFCLIVLLSKGAKVNALI